MITSNIPATPLITSGKASYGIGDRVRLIVKSERHPESIFAGNSYIGKIVNITDTILCVSVPGGIIVKDIEDIVKIRKARPSESFINTPFYNKAERQFWKRYMYAHDGIKPRR